MANVKKYVLTAVTLGLIAMASGALIGATNLITADRIAENEVKKINASFVEIYGEGATGTENESFNFNEYTYLKSQYEIFSSDGASIGMPPVANRRGEGAQMKWCGNLGVRVE